MIRLDLFFATSNVHKFTEAKEILPKSANIKQFRFEYTEIRSDSLEDIARDAADAAYKQCRESVFVEDSGLFITALNGFPGTYSSWTLEKLGLDGILKLMKGVENRDATFEACIAYRDRYETHVFHGACHGRIADGKRGDDGFGYDPIFIPEGHEQTFAESITLKNKLSHRYKTLLEFSEFLKSRE